MARTRAQDYDAKRDTILGKAADLFAKHGYPGTSISMIAEACGVSKALLYHWRVPSSRLLSAGRSLALVVFEPRLHELVEFLHLFVGVGFWRAVFQPTEHVSFD